MVVDPHARSAEASRIVQAPGLARRLRRIERDDLWAIFPPLAVLALQGLRRSVIWFVAFFAELVVLALLDPRLCRTRRRSRRAS